jgi:DivIVA domain-containing protein
MGTVLLVLVVVLVIAGLVYGVVTLLAGEDPGLSPSDPDGRARPLPNNRSLSEYDLKAVRFDVGFRGYRMTQVDRVLRRTAYDIGYKDEMIAVLEAEVIALREGRAEDAELLRKAREQAAAPAPPAPVAGRAPGTHRAGADEADVISNDDEYEDASLSSDGSTSDDSDETGDEPDPDDPTAPGLLNRAALRQVELPDHGSSETSAEASTEPSAEPGPSSDPSEPDASSEPSAAKGDTEASAGDVASGAERRART